MPSRVTSLVDPRLPEDWRRFELPEGVAFAREADLRRHQNEVRNAQLSVFITITDAPSLSELAEKLMARRVMQGYPERFSLSIAGLDALGFDWTDGVAYVRSYFVTHPRGPAVEFQVATYWYPDDPPLAPLASFADDLLRNVRWL